MWALCGAIPPWAINISLDYSGSEAFSHNNFHQALLSTAISYTFWKGPRPLRPSGHDDVDEKVKVDINLPVAVLGCQHSSPLNRDEKKFHKKQQKQPTKMKSKPLRHKTPSKQNYFLFQKNKTKQKQPFKKLDFLRKHETYFICNLGFFLFILDVDARK